VTETYGTLPYGEGAVFEGREGAIGRKASSLKAWGRIGNALQAERHCRSCCVTADRPGCARTAPGWWCSTGISTSPGAALATGTTFWSSGSARLLGARCSTPVWNSGRRAWRSSSR